MEPWIFTLATKIMEMPERKHWEVKRDDIARLIEDEMFEHFGRQVAEAPVSLPSE